MKTIKQSLSALAMIAFAALSMTGCALQQAVLPPNQATPSANTWTVIDERPAKEKEYEIISGFAHSCDFGIYRLGDNVTSPPLMDILRTDLSRQAGTVANRTITIKHYVVYFNHGLFMLSHGPMSGGLLGALESDHRRKCTREETSVGWFGPDEVTTPFSPYVIEISAKYGERDITVRTVYSNTQEFNLQFAQPDTAAALFYALRQASSDLAIQIVNP